MPGKLIILPNVLEESLGTDPFLPAGVGVAVQEIVGLIAESEKSGRRFLRRFLSHEEMNRRTLQMLNEHTEPKALADLLAPLERGETWGLISDAGLACIADPGSDLVALANQKGVRVETFAGPSSLMMALQLSGFCGQRFTFHGYLPKELPDLEKKIKEMEARSKNETQIWIEAPYRSQKMLEFLKAHLSANTRLCVAASLTTADQKVLSQPISAWKDSSFSLGKEPAVFLLDSHPLIFNKGIFIK
jgi:16S rRNA (cytidine1402-2'-O)-methyltransferase